MAEAGLGPAIINVKTLGADERNGLFGLTVFVGAILAVAFFLLAPVFAEFYQIHRVDEVVPFVAVSLFFYSASIIPTAFLLRDQCYFRIAHAGLAAEIISTLSTLVLMVWIDPLYALSSKAPFTALTNYLVVYYSSSKTEFGRPIFGSMFFAIKPLLSFSLYQFGFNFINYFSRNLDNILVGKILGAGSLGIYDKAYQLMRYPLMLLTFSMTPAIQPALKKYALDKNKVEQIHGAFTFKLSLIGAFAGVLMFTFGDKIVWLLLGEQWNKVTPIVHVLSLSIPVQVVLSTSGSFFQALNHARLLFFSGFISAIVMILAIMWGIYQRDLIALSWALVIAFHINFVQAYYILYSKVFGEKMFLFFVRMLPAGLVVFWMGFAIV